MVSGKPHPDKPGDNPHNRADQAAAKADTIDTVRTLFEQQTGG